MTAPGVTTALVTRHTFYQEGKTTFRLAPGARADRSAPDITPLLVAFGAHRGALDDGWAQDAMFRMTAFMAGGQAARRRGCEAAFHRCRTRRAATSVAACAATSALIELVVGPGCEHQAAALLERRRSMRLDAPMVRLAGRRARLARLCPPCPREHHFPNACTNAAAA